MKQQLRYRLLVGAVAAVAVTSTALANHNWRKYHWATTTGILSLDVGDNVSSVWDPYLTEAINDWNGSVVLDLTRAAGGTSPSTCAPRAGRIEACNASYGDNGWLGVAQIWIQGGSHIYQAVTKLNDTYFQTATYNTPAWRRLVTCQEIAHDFGLDHQDERFNNANLGSCMDYTNDPDGGPGGASSTDPSNEHPNNHDFQQLLTIYGHKDATGTAQGGGLPPNAARPEASDWGQLVRTNANNRVQVYEKDLGSGGRLITHVFWANPEEDEKGRHDH